MRRLLAVLRDTEPEGRPPTTTLRSPHSRTSSALVAHVRGLRRTGRAGRGRDPAGLPPGVDLSAYRIVQEALTNVLKHAADARARVVLEYADDALAVTVHRRRHPRPVDGTEAGGGHGLIGIRERVAVVGGEVGPAPGPSGGFASGPAALRAGGSIERSAVVIADDQPLVRTGLRMILVRRARHRGRGRGGRRPRGDRACAETSRPTWS